MEDPAMRKFAMAAALLTTPGVVGCGGSPPTIINSTTRTEEQVIELRKEADQVAAQERANLAGERYFPRDEEAERVEAEERANLATTPRR
jgi:hypothetical protein